MPPRISSGLEYERCLGLLTVEPASAENLARAWVARGGGEGAMHCLALSRLALGEPVPAAERRIWMLQLDRATGQLTLDEAFRDAGSARPGLAFDRAAWPHGVTGTAVPHGTVFGW